VGGRRGSEAFFLNISMFLIFCAIIEYNLQIGFSRNAIKRQCPNHLRDRSGGIGRFRDTLWAAALEKEDVRRWGQERIKARADEYREAVFKELATSQ
jgi:hypothetical protein